MPASMRTSYSLLICALVACQNPSKLDPLAKIAPAPAPGSGSAAATAPAGEDIDLDSKDILARTDVASEVDVKHVLIAWKELAAQYQGHIDPRAKDRSNADAADLAREVADKLRAAKPDAVDDIIKKYSEDPSMAASAEPYTIAKDTEVPERFRDLALRLKLGEIGIVKTAFGYHVTIRTPPPPPDPLESTDILSRPAGTGPVKVQHVLIGWKDSPAAKQGRADERAMKRTKAEADKLASDVLARARAGEDFGKLMKELSEDPGSKDNARAYDVASNTQLVEPFKKLALRLKPGEVGIVKTPFGWHIMRIEPPEPPDSLESRDILKREQVTDNAKVKHILLGWKDVHGKDPRGEKRERPALEKLVNDTVAKLKKGAKIEPLMKELSEDPGSAQSGDSYPVTPDAGLVESFKNLSLRLKVGEVGVVKTQFGIHIIQRVE
jgi:parvulin-like peptidyl-prolyl isomerase